MKAEINSIWDSNRRRPNVYLTLRPENDTEKALLRALYAIKPRWVASTSGSPMLDFYPEGD
jgi:hypothetical protein